MRPLLIAIAVASLAACSSETSGPEKERPQSRPAAPPAKPAAEPPAASAPKPAASGEPETTANPVCAELLPAEDLERFCGEPVTLTPTPKEDGKSVFCNRTGPGGLVFSITRHPDEATAVDVSQEGRQGVVLATRDRYTLRLESSDASGEPVCDTAELKAMAAPILERLSDL